MAGLFNMHRRNYGIVVRKTQLAPDVWNRITSNEECVGPDGPRLVDNKVGYTFPFMDNQTVLLVGTRLDMIWSTEEEFMLETVSMDDGTTQTGVMPTHVVHKEELAAINEILDKLDIGRTVDEFKFATYRFMEVYST